jgi:TetR/AcrR family transcriptional regulator
LITTAGLAKTVGVSEAALYRHFPSKYKMYEGLIEYIEEVIFSRVSHIMEEEQTAATRCEKILWLVLVFAEKNPGLARLLYGDALAGERDKLRLRVTQFFDRINTQLKQVFRDAEVKENLRTVATPSQSAALLVAFLDGKISQYARSGFRDTPTQGWQEQWLVLRLGVLSPRASAF